MYVHNNYICINIVRYPLRKSSRASLVAVSSKTTSSSATDSDGSSFWISLKRKSYISYFNCICPRALVKIFQLTQIYYTY